jgi:hypothetical protein
VVTTKNILLLVSAVFAPAIPRRDASTILSDIFTIDTNVKALTSAVNSYSSRIFVPFLLKPLRAHWTSPSSNAPVMLKQYLNSLWLIPTALLPLSRISLLTFEACFQALNAKKFQLAAAGLTSTVQNDLATLKSDTDSLANSLVATASAETADQAHAEKTITDNDFQGAIKDFAN